MSLTGTNGKPLAHHKKSDVSFNRPAYREARLERAVKVYTVNNESRHLIVQNVPTIKVERELIQLFAQYGHIEQYERLVDYPRDQYTDVYWLKYQRIQSARFGKKKSDNHSFFGSQLHVCYAPEYETVDDVRNKWLERKRLVRRKCKEYVTSAAITSPETTKTSSPVTSTSNPSVASLVESSKHQLSGSSGFFLRSSGDSVPIASVKSINTPNFATTCHNSDNHPSYPEFPRIASHNASLPIEIQNLQAKEVYSEEFLPRAPSTTEQTIKSTSGQSEIEKAPRKERVSSMKRFVWNLPSELRHSDTHETFASTSKQENLHAHIRRSEGTQSISHPLINSIGTDVSQPQYFEISENRSHSYTGTPGAWDPFHESRVKNTGAMSTDGIDVRNDIRRRLNKTAEPSRTITYNENKICPLQLSTIKQPLLNNSLPKQPQPENSPPVKKKIRKSDGRKRI